MDELSTTTLGLALPETRPPAPNKTSFKSSVVDTIVKTTWQLDNACLLGAMVAPYSTSGSALAAVRFHTLTGCPALSSRLTIASPIRPKPIHPIVLAMSHILGV